MTARTDRQPNRLRAWIPAVLWMGVIWLLSEQPHSGEMTEKFLGRWNIAVRKLAHMSEYAILFYLLRRALIQTARPQYSKEIAPSSDGDEHCLPVLLEEASSPGKEAEHCARRGVGSGAKALVLSVFYAMTDEWHQSYVPGRSATIGDTLVDTAGACLGWAAVYLVGIISKRGKSDAN